MPTTTRSQSPHDSNVVPFESRPDTSETAPTETAPKKIAAGVFAATRTRPPKPVGGNYGVRLPPLPSWLGIAAVALALWAVLAE